MRVFGIIAAVALGALLLLGCVSCAKNEPETPDVTAQTDGDALCTLSFHSFDGGGPSYDVSIGDESVVSCTSERQYNDPDHDQIDGAAYNVILSFKGLKTGSTTVTVVSNSPIMESETWVYTAVVDETLRVTLTEQDNPA